MYFTKKLFLIFCMLSCFSVPAYAINKCVDENGKVSYISGRCPQANVGSNSNISSTRPYIYPIAVNKDNMTVILKMNADWVVKETVKETDTGLIALEVTSPKDKSFKNIIIYRPYAAGSKRKRLSKQGIFDKIKMSFGSTLNQEQQLISVNNRDASGYRFTATDPRWLSRIPPKGEYLYISKIILDLRHGFLEYTTLYNDTKSTGYKDTINSLQWMQNKKTQFNRRLARYIRETRNLPAKNLQVKARRNFLRAMKKESPEDQFLVGQWLSESDQTEAKTWYQLAAKRGYIPAIQKQNVR